MAISKKQMKGKLRILLNSKKDIVQPGRLLAHLMNELNLTGKGSNAEQNKECIAECLDELEADGLVTLVKKGKVYDEVHRTTRQRAIRSDVRQAKKAKSKTVAHSQPVVTFNKEGEAEKPTMSTATVEPRPVSETESSLEIIRIVTEKAEKQKENYKAEVEAHAKTKACKAAIETAKGKLEEQLEERDRTIRKMEEASSLLQAENTQLQTALSNGTTLLESAEAKLMQANARIVELEAEAKAGKDALSGAITDLATRIKALDD